MAVEFIVPVLLWLLVVKMLHLAVWPALDRTLGNLSAAAAYPASILLFTLGTWYLGLTGLPIVLAILPFAVAIAYAGSRRFFTRERLRSALTWDLAFLLPFLFMLEVRWINPSISYAEKFMDHAILASIMRAPPSRRSIPGTREGRWTSTTTSATGRGERSGLYPACLLRSPSTSYSRRCSVLPSLRSTPSDTSSSTVTGGSRWLRSSSRTFRQSIIS